MESPVGFGGGRAVERGQHSLLGKEGEPEGGQVWQMLGEQHEAVWPEKTLVATPRDVCLSVGHCAI